MCPSFIRWEWVLLMQHQHLVKDALATGWLIVVKTVSVHVVFIHISQPVPARVVILTNFYRCDPDFHIAIDARSSDHILGLFRWRFLQDLRIN